MKLSPGSRLHSRFPTPSIDKTGSALGSRRPLTLLLACGFAIALYPFYEEEKCLVRSAPPGPACYDPAGMESPRHTALVRVTHWITALCFIGLLVSGVAILLAHPRLYWGEAGNVGTPSILDLPLPFVLVGQSGWGRSLHFLSAWVSVLTGLVYVFSLRRNPAYNRLQQLTYFGVVLALFPLMILTGFAMSPAITSVVPAAVTIFGGQQSARTIHFFAGVLLVVFLLVHVAMVFRAGFTSRVGAMITSRKEAA